MTFLAHVFAVCKDSSRRADWLTPQMSVEIPGHEPCKCPHFPALTLPYMFYHPTVHSTGQGNAVEGESVPGKEYSLLERDQGREGAGNPSFPWGKPITIFRPAPPPTHTAKFYQAESKVVFCRKVPPRLSPGKRGFLCPLYTPCQ